MVPSKRMSVRVDALSAEEATTPAMPPTETWRAAVDVIFPLKAAATETCSIWVSRAQPTTVPMQSMLLLIPELLAVRVTSSKRTFRMVALWVAPKKPIVVNWLESTTRVRPVIVWPCPSNTPLKPLVTVGMSA